MNDLDDGTYISPNNILFGRSTSEVPELNLFKNWWIRFGQSGAEMFSRHQP